MSSLPLASSYLLCEQSVCIGILIRYDNDQGFIQKPEFGRRGGDVNCGPKVTNANFDEILKNDILGGGGYSQLPLSPLLYESLMTRM